MNPAKRHRSRPDTSPAAIKQALMNLGHKESWAGPAVSDIRLIVPLLLSQLGTEKVVESIREAWKEYQLSDEWLTAVSKSAVQWAEYALDTYRQQSPE